MAQNVTENIMFNMSPKKRYSDKTSIVAGRVVVVTPTTGSKYLEQCVSSVRDQTYENIVHVVVVDGEERLASTREEIARFNTKIIVLPEVTGSDGFQGHR